jgi:hypothetical protein
MESLLVLAKAYRSVERVELTLEGLRGLGGDTEVAMVADSIYQRLNEIEARQELTQQPQELEMLAELEQSEVEDQLAQRRERLGLEPETVASETPASSATPAPAEPGPEPPPTEPTPEEPSPPDTPETPPSPAA